MANHKNDKSKYFLSLLILVFISFPPILFANSNWIQTSDTDFNSGTLNDVMVKGTGISAEVLLISNTWINCNRALRLGYCYCYCSVTAFT